MGGGGVILIGAGAGYAAPLSRGFGIGPGRNFALGGSQRMERTAGLGYEFYFRRAYGPWANEQNRYLGVEFLIGAETHYGWIRLTVTIGSDLQPLIATVTGYAYETVAKQSIHAGQLTEQASVPAHSPPMAPASLGALALGSPGLRFWRREAAVLAAERRAHFQRNSDQGSLQDLSS